MKCPNCGVDIEQNANFCTNCGKNIETKTTVVNNIEQQPKKKNTALIIVLIILGVLFLFIIGIVLLILLFIGNINKGVKENKKGYEPEVKEEVKNIYSSYKDGDVIKRIKDPLGHEITIVKNSSFIVMTDTNYLYDKAVELEKTAQKMTVDQIETSEASNEQKEAMKIVVESLSGYVAEDQYEIIETLKEKKYSTEIIDYAIKYSGVDWEEQAMIQTVIIAAGGGYSKKEIMDMMIYRGFSEEAATKAVDNKLVDYYEQGVSDACFYKYTEKMYSGVYNREQAKEALKNKGFTDEETDFALKEVYDGMK